MPAGILEHDKIVSLEKTWHGLEEIVEAIDFGNSGLDWQVEKRPLFFPCGTDNCPVKGWEAVVRKDLDLILNVPKDSYTIIQNSRVFEAVQKALEGIGHKIQVTGSLQNCRKVFVSISLDGNTDYLVGTDKFRNYLTFCSSHDGSLVLEAYDTAIRVVCENTLNWSRASKGSVNMKVYHTKNNEVKIQDMEKHLNALFEKRVEFYKTLEVFAGKAVSIERANKIITGFIGKGEELSTRAENQINEIMGLFQNGRGNKGKTFYDLLNGVTEYYTHRASDNKVKLLSSNEFGSYSGRKLEFYKMLLSDAEIKETAALGEKLIQAIKKKS